MDWPEKSGPPLLGTVSEVSSQLAERVNALPHHFFEIWLEMKVYGRHLRESTGLNVLGTGTEHTTYSR